MTRRLLFCYVLGTLPPHCAHLFSDENDFLVLRKNRFSFFLDLNLCSGLGLGQDQ
jgi:hypothetical protein